MTTNAIDTVDTSWKGLYKWGGISAILVAVIYIVTIVLALRLGVPSSLTGEGFFKWFSSQTSLAYAFYGLSMLSDILAVPVLLALYLALKGVSKSAVLVAAGFGGLFIALDLGVYLITSVALVTLSQSYAAATSSTQQAAYLATADYAVGIATVSATIYSAMGSALWVLITSLVMLKGIFSKATSYVGILSSIFLLAYGLTVFVPYSSAVSVLLAIAGLLLAIFLFLAGSRLYRLGKR